MTSRATQIETLIGSLDTIFPNDPPSAWYPACETLQRELRTAEEIERRFGVVGPTVALVAFIAFEASHLSMAVTAPLSLIGLCVLTMTFGPDPRTRLSALALLAPLIGWVTMLIPGANNYAVLALLLTLGINYLLSRIYPALEHRERITFLLDYFGFSQTLKPTP